MTALVKVPKGFIEYLKQKGITSKKEVELVYETLQESLKVSTTKAPIKESLGSASKVLGNASAKPIIEVDNQFARWQQLAGIKK